MIMDSDELSIEEKIMRTPGKITYGGKWLGFDEEDNCHDDDDILLPKKKKITSATKSKFQGDIPNLEWKMFSEKQLHEHERFIPLTKKKVKDLKKPKLFKYISQKDPLWKLARLGRLTMSRAAATLGFMEAKTVKYLKMPKYMVGHQSIVDVYEKMYDKTYSQNPPNSITAVRMQWGTNQEPNAIINTLEYNKGFIVKETGFELLTGKRLRTILKKKKDDPIIKYLPSIGGSPDGILCDKNGKEIATLECKCGCPFREASNKEKEKYLGEFCYNSRTKPHDTIKEYYIPQTQGQMMITGKTKGVYTSYSPMRGTTIFQTNYNREYCRLMLIYFAKFNKRYVMKGVKPPKDPFYGEELYMKLLDMTKEIQEATGKTRREVEKSVTNETLKEKRLFLD